MDTTGTNLHRYVASDEYGYSLGYFAGDYSEINTPTNEWLADKSGTELQDSTYGLYNGNISRMVTSIREFVQGNSNEIFANVYRYDQLNRLTKTRNYTSNDVIGSNNWNSASMNYDYGVNIGYDKNGNILTLDRNADVNSNNNFDAMDKFEYVYEDTLNGYPRNTNKLLSVDEQRDNSGNSMAGYDDIKPGQISGDNYSYDDIGNLIEDEQQEIEEIEWTITGKVKSVSRTSSSTKPDLEFEYDPLGNRIHKKVINKNSQYLLANVVDYYYIRDAQGNIMSIYKTMNNEIGNTIESTFSQADNPIYGSDRIGVQERNQWLVKQEYSTQSGNPVLVSTDYFAGNGNVKDQYRGDKDYELKNHLGNVLAVVSDKRTPVFNTVTQNFENFDAIVLGAQEYYPFGSILPSRSYNSTEYRFGFNGKEKIDEITGSTGATYDYGFRIYDARIARFLSVDPLTKDYPWYTPYQFAGNKPIWAVDLDGLEESVYTDSFKNRMGKAFLVIENSKRLKTLYNNVNRADKKAKIKVIYTVSAFDNTIGFVQEDAIGTAEWVKYYRKNGTSELSKKQQALFNEYDKLFKKNKIDIDKDILSEKDKRKVIIVNINPDKSNPISSLMHELRAHLKQDVEGTSKSEIKEHEDYYNIEENPELKSVINTGKSPRWEDVPKNSEAGKDIKAVNEAIDKINEKK